MKPKSQWSPQTSRYRSTFAFILFFFNASHQVPFVVVALYMVALYCGTKYMAKRGRCDLRHPLALWNAMLCIFSFAGAARTVPELLWRLGSQDLGSTMCDDPSSSWGAGATGLWVQLFIFSKVFLDIQFCLVVAASPSNRVLLRTILPWHQRRK